MSTLKDVKDNYGPQPPETAGFQMNEKAKDDTRIRTLDDLARAKERLSMLENMAKDESLGATKHGALAKLIRGNIQAARLDELFSQHQLSEEDAAKCAIIRREARDFAGFILAFTPEGPDQSAALRLVREAMMTANAAISLKGWS